MKIFTISDLHLSLSVDKPMNIFGDSWEGHFEKIREDWNSRVSDEDIVLVAGDLSWGINYDEAREDLRAICSLPGSKVLIRGNHDLWHQSVKKTRAELTNNTYFLQNDHVKIGDWYFAGTRGWKQREEQDFTSQDEKIYKRETARLERSLASIPEGAENVIGMIHYPPFSRDRENTPFTEIFSKYGVKLVVYGHLHGDIIYDRSFEDIKIGDTRYLLTSCDFLGFRLKEIAAGEKRV